MKYIQDELWKNNILRQGWGIHGLDLRHNTKKWIENYMLYGKIYWDVDIECKAAKGRWNILRRMVNISVDDIILLPKTSENHLDDYNEFTVCQLEKKYYFDCSSKILDFGHCLKIKNIESFEYKEDTLLQGDFSSPYLWAITEVQLYHNKYEKFKKFIEKEYIKD